MHACFRTLAACLTLALAVPALAHHGGAVEYDAAQQRGPVTGIVTVFAFTFPHPYIDFDVKGPNGVEKWSAVLQPTPTNLRAAGWARDSLKPGDSVTVSGSAHKTAPNILLARRVEVNGKLLEQGN